MERSILGLQLQREIVFVANPADNFFAAADGRGYESRLPVAGRRGSGDRAPNLLHGVSARVAGQIGGDKTALTGNHVATGASRFPEEGCLSADWITGQFHGLLCSLKSTEVDDDCLDVGTFKRVEGRHGGAGKAIHDN